MVAVSAVSGYGQWTGEEIICRYCEEMFASLDNMVRHFVNEHYEAWIGENLKSIRISAELVLKNIFVGEPVNEREENWYSDMNPRDSRGVIKRCFNCATFG